MSRCSALCKVKRYAMQIVLLSLVFFIARFSAADGQVKISMANQSCLPEYMTAGSTGADLKACIKDEIILQPGEVKIIDTGIQSLQFPDHLMPTIMSRAGLGFEGITVDFISRIDRDYTGFIQVPLRNRSDKPFVVKSGMRIAQIIFINVERPDIVLDPAVKDRQIESRGKARTGSTGLD